jgi:hypothetical protein
MRNVSYKGYREDPNKRTFTNDLLAQPEVAQNRNKRFVFNNFFFENHAFYEIMWENAVELGRLQMTIWRMHMHSG